VKTIQPLFDIDRILSHLMELNSVSRQSIGQRVVPLFPLGEFFIPGFRIALQPCVSRVRFVQKPLPLVVFNRFI
jgi:hypothetical protein